jgi:DNA topoisomerase I
MNLIIVESPTKARTLSKFLGGQYKITATMGHIKDLPKSKLSVDVENNFKPDYVLNKKSAKTVKEISSLAKNSETVYLATDPDREGEAIAYHARELVFEKNKKPGQKIYRIVFHEITREAVEQALKKPREVDSHLVDAQIARRVLDRIVGYKLSPLLWKKVRRGLSAGRVQSVAVRLIVEREKEIKKFKSSEYWEIASIVRSQKTVGSALEFAVGLIKIGDKKAGIGDEKKARDIVYDLEKSTYSVIDIKRKEVKKSPYPPFTTSTMTQSASRLFGWSAKKTMSVAQKLYEEGLITYHRTDSVNISGSAINEVRSYIVEEFGDKYLPEKPKFFKKQSKNAQEAHEAIRPTHVNLEFKLTDSKFEKDGEKLFSLIWKRFVASQMRESVFDETAIDVLAENKNGKKYTLRASGQVMKFDGWRKIIPLKKDEAPSLPAVESGEVLKLIKVNSEQKFTQPPARYNEASLIKTLEKLGIGRPSTYAPIITTIQLRNYVEKNEGKFHPTSIGFAVNEFLETNFEGIVDYSFTAEMEKKLDDVAKGELQWDKMMADFYNPFDKKLTEVETKAKRVKIEVESLGIKCPTCEKEGRVGDKQGDLVIRTGRFGKFISCSLFPECKHTEKFVEKIDVMCPDCGTGDVIVKTTKKGRKFFGCSRYPDCNWASWQKPNGTNKKE